MKKERTTDSGREAEERIRLMLDACPLSVALYDRDLQLVDFNEGALKLYGIPGKEEFLANKRVLLPPTQPDGRDSMLVFRQLFDATLETGKAQSRLCALKNDDTPFFAEITTVRVQYGGQPAIVLYTRDLTEEKTAADKEREANLLQKRIYDAIPISASLWTPELEIVDCNIATVELLRLSGKEEYMKEFYKFVPEHQPDGTPSTEKIAAIAKEAFGKGFCRTVFTCRLPDGELIPGNVTAMKVEFGEKFLAAVYFQDLRPLLEAEEKLREQEIDERIRLMFDATPLIIEYWDRAHNPINCNETALTFYGLADTDEYRQRLMDITPDYQPDGSSAWANWNARLDEIFARGHGKFEITEQKTNGEVVSMEVDGVRMFYDNDYVVVTYAKDVTQLRAIQKEQEALLQQLETAVSNEQAANNAKRKFLTNMSHEIRTPMSAIIGMTGIAKNTADIKRKDDAIQKIEKASKHLLGIINQILDISKIEAERFELDYRSFNFAEMLDEVLSILSIKMEEKKLTPEVVLDDAIPRFIVSDELRLAQVVTNLLSNAVKFTPAGGKVRLAATVEKNILRVEVSDNGIGIPKEHHASLFDAFMQAESNITYKSEGTGLGLTIARWIVEKMGGGIWVESAPNKGACFTFTVPVTEGGEPDETPVYVAEASAELPRNMYAGYTILTVEDVEVNREIVSEMLATVGIRVECAEDGSRALQMFAAAPERYDMIFMDIQMPVMDGLTATRQLRRLGTEKAKSIPIVAMTANVFKEDVKSCLEAGMNGHLGKPLDFNQIMAMLRLYLRE